MVTVNPRRYGRWIVLLAALAVLVSLLVPHHASAATTAAAPAHAAAQHRDVPNDSIKNYALQHYVGGDGNGYLSDNGRYSSFTAHYLGQVSNSGETPFTPGSGFNATYNGDNMWYFTETGSPSTCINVGGAYAVMAQSCGATHDGSIWVSTASAPNGVSGVHGLVNVYDTDAAGAGRYLEDPGSGLKQVVVGYAYGSDYESWVF